MIKFYFTVIVVLFSTYSYASQKTASNSDVTPRISTPTGQTPPSSSEVIKVNDPTPEETRAHREDLRKQVRSQGPEKTLDSFFNQ